MRYKHSNLGQIKTDGPETGQPHFDAEQEIPGLRQRPLQGDHPSVALFLSAEVTFLVAPHDGKADAVLRYGVRRAHSEDVGRRREVGGKREAVKGDSQGERSALASLPSARQELATTGEGEANKPWKTRRAG